VSQAIGGTEAPGAARVEGLTLFPERPDWDVQVMRLVAEAESGGSDVFECVRTAGRIRERGLTEPVWREEWQRLGRALARRAEEDLAAGPAGATSAVARLLRATNYLRTAEFFVPHGADLRRELFDETQATFRKAVPHLPVETTVIEVADGDATYEGYVFRGRGASEEAPGPGVVFLGGADSYAEELYSFGGRAMAERGMTVIVADTPGRGGTLRRHGIVSRPDYEVPAAKVVDALEKLPFVDPSRIGAVGLSLGGYYAPRLASADDRIRALVCWCACFDVLNDLYLYYPPIRSQLRWIVGAAGEDDALEKLAEFTLADVAAKITCPILISHGEQDDLMPASSARRLYESVSSDDRTIRIWKPGEGGALHCNYDNWADCFPFMFDWLAVRLGSAGRGR